ncbi:LysR substrate-binding domain-containing protein [Dasania sp. GY-MA-18]|uniref:LysR substrate-binding domain-containing protein n=1 Tax=Dasania phycosphaerae TaxID=2950436 RepID=A0A9J6RIM4_9GAMM|nr:MULTISPECIES: LysR substrate-binding domain-containing protein [Dasania]MCR8921856.1 LysR substrate-binding domain-containing protein [Dasania sp. GY-MA-18]MCZ0864284.1 LysR substrate-binding domain-containing protein [Dasania phycosphaerae]MCZ0868012.1 LysR substrate-binding domain-containing protein [Dasania phycosphaerae]
MSDDKINDLTPPSSNLPTRKSLPPFEALRAFDAVARLGGVRKAAQHLCRDHAVVSRHLKSIEDWTSAKLIERTPAGAVLTEDGLRYHQEISQAIDMIANATVELMKHNNVDQVQVWSMPGFTLQWLMARLGKFEKAYPSLDIELRPTNKGPDFERREADVDIRFSPYYRPALELPAYVRALEIARPPIIAVASPEYLQREEPIKTPADLLNHHLLHEDGFERWRAWLAANGIDEDIELSGPRLWQSHLTLEAARHHSGVALTNYLVAADDLKNGRLLDVGANNPDFKNLALGAYLFIAREDRWDAIPIDRFRRWLLKMIKEEFPEAMNVSEDEFMVHPSHHKNRYS